MAVKMVPIRALISLFFVLSKLYDRLAKARRYKWLC